MCRAPTKEAAVPDGQEDKVARRRREAAKRALAEAEARRKAARPVERPVELGRKGPDPARYGDWEKKGIASDF